MRFFLLKTEILILNISVFTVFFDQIKCSIDEHKTLLLKYLKNLSDPKWSEVVKQIVMKDKCLQVLEKSLCYEMLKNILPPLQPLLE